MRFTVNRDVLSDAVSFAVKLLPQRPTLPLLSGVLMEAADGQLTISTFDYEVSARTTIAADVQVAGRTLVSGRMLSEIANRFPNADVEVSVADNHVKLVCGPAKFSLPEMPAQEYPQIPVVDTVSGSVPGDEFADAVSQVALAASKDDIAPVMTGVFFEVDENSLTLTATDRYRVATRKIAWESEGASDKLNALVPSKIATEVGKTLASEGVIKVAIVRDDERELVAFTAGSKTVTSLLIKGNFPPVGRLFPTQVDHYAVMNRAELSEAVGRVQLVLERDAALRFNFAEGYVELEAVGTESAEARERVDAHLFGKDMVVGLKPQYLLDALRSIHSEFVRIAFTNSDNPGKPGPVLITRQASDESGEVDYRYLLQPNLLLR